MTIRILQFNESAVTPADDAELYKFMLSDESGIFKDCNITEGAGNIINVSSGRMIIHGRVIVLEDEEVNAKVSPSGTQNGRLLLRVDMSKNLEEVVSLDTQVAANLPDLIQEDINVGGNIYELELATYSCNEIDISNMTVNENIRLETVIEKLNKPFTWGRLKGS